MKYYLSFLDGELLKLYFRKPRVANNTLEDHLRAGIQWLCRAQDAFDDGGVARSYSLAYHRGFQKKGWMPSYPETTGYIIPTMFDYAHFADEQEIHDRAIRMADWECKVQMENGAVQGGTIDQVPSPAIFNTGQVIFGWIRAFQETRKEKYLQCAMKAGEYLVEQQDEDGAWRRFLSNYASSKMNFYTYNTRTAWALLMLSAIDGGITYRNAAIRNIEFALNHQSDNGWFESNCLNDPSQPLLHTIAYCIRGILEAGILLDNNHYVDSARKAAEALISRQRSDGSLAGRFNDRWEPTVPWSCLTGDAQISIIWGRLFQITGEIHFLYAMKKINRFLDSVHLVRTKNENIYGGICGSHPIYGKYGRYEILSWAVKFYLDALLLEHSISNS